MGRIPLAAIAVLSAGSAACTGTIGGGEGAPEDDRSAQAGPAGDDTPAGAGSGPAGASADGNDPEAPVADPTGRTLDELVCDESLRGTVGDIRRLSNAELLASYRALFTDLDDDAFQQAFRLLPEDASQDPGLEFDNGQLDVEALYTVASVLVDASLQDATRRERVLGACADPATDASCIDGVVDDFAPRVMRRPLTGEEQQRLRAHAAEVGGGDGVRFAMIRLLMSPEFTQHLELGVEEGAEPPATQLADRPGTIALTQHEVAARLSYHLTGGPPDAALVTDASDGQLTSTDALEAHARRLLATDAARDKLRSVVHHWLALSAVPDPDPAVATHLGLSSPDGFGDEARDELLRFAEHVVFDAQGGFTELLTDKTAFPATERLAIVYGLAQGDAPASFEDVRGGLLLRAAPLLSTTAHSSPIYRGRFVRTRLLCQQLGAPSPETLAAGIAAVNALSPQELSTREIVAQVTGSPACQGCHSLLNPIGFALEELGPAGEFRTEEAVLDDAGAVIATHPIDSAVTNLALDDGAMQDAAGAAELAALLARSERAPACFAWHLVANTRMRQPTDADACLIADTVSVLRDGGSVLDALATNAAAEDAFWRPAP